MLTRIMTMEDPSRRDLVLQLYQRYKRALLLYANSILCDQATAEDVVQNIFAKLVERPELLKYERPEENKAYLMTMAHHMSINHLRSAGQETPYDESLDADCQDGGNVDDGLLLREAYRFARDLVETLPPLYKDVIFLRYIKGLDDAEIGAIVGASVNNVRVRIHRALKMLQAVAREGGAEHA